MNLHRKQPACLLLYLLVGELLLCSFTSCLNADLNDLQSVFDQHKKNGFVPMRGRKNFDKLDNLAKKLFYKEEPLYDKQFLFSNVLPKNMNQNLAKDPQRLLPLITFLNNIGYKRAGFVPMRGRKSDPTLNHLNSNPIYDESKYFRPNSLDSSYLMNDLFFDTNSRTLYEPIKLEDMERKVFYPSRG